MEDRVEAELLHHAVAADERRRPDQPVRPHGLPAARGPRRELNDRRHERQPPKAVGVGVEASAQAGRRVRGRGGGKAHDEQARKKREVEIGPARGQGLRAPRLPGGQGEATLIDTNFASVNSGIRAPDQAKGTATTGRKKRRRQRGWSVSSAISV